MRVARQDHDHSVGSPHLASKCQRDLMEEPFSRNPPRDRIPGAAGVSGSGSQGSCSGILRPVLWTHCSWAHGADESYSSRGDIGLGQASVHCLFPCPVPLFHSHGILESGGKELLNEMPSHSEGPFFVDCSLEWPCLGALGGLWSGPLAPWC
ncbi:hypothetical protein DPEC_G00185760 [Dallia pectoralis]|uniref:Uncharacterized protein n=1 Tax=Dallia pectoralis TaxID=75939 RepID=A0ACC2GBP3_DALPE|nr:hypothetical protein DPEC_G00185760 [Dallia pectoralis]